MNTDRLQDALRRAAERQPNVPGRADSALRLAVRRRNTRLVATSCAAAVLAVVGSVTLTGGSGSAGLRPVVPVESPTESPTYGTYDPSASPTSEATPTSEAELDTTPEPSEPPREGEPIDPPPDTVIDPGPLRHQPLDVFVLFDGTVSMQSTEDAAKLAIARIDERLRAHGFDVAWGLGVYGDAGVESAARRGSPLVYELVQQIGEARQPDLRLARDMGGDSDQREGATFGLDGLLGIAHTPYSVPEDAAAWNVGAQRLVLLVTDAGVMQGGSYPDLAESIGHLTENGVVVAGLQAFSANTAEWARDGLDAIAKGTGAVVTRAVRCGSAGAPDLAAGAPLVCPINEPFESGSSSPSVDVTGFADALADLMDARATR